MDRRSFLKFIGSSVVLAQAPVFAAIPPREIELIYANSVSELVLPPNALLALEGIAAERGSLRLRRIPLGGGHPPFLMVPLEPNVAFNHSWDRGKADFPSINFSSTTDVMCHFRITNERGDPISKNVLLRTHAARRLYVHIAVERPIYPLPQGIQRR